MSSVIEKKRSTKETNISATLVFRDREQSTAYKSLDINTPVPFFTHMLNALLFHGGWDGSIHAEGDVEVDFHHLVEDTGIVLGTIFSEYAFKNQPIARFGHAVVPMDDALAETTIDFSNRAFLHYKADFPQMYIGNFDAYLGREFFTSLAHNAKMNLHIEARYGLNSHHILEAIFKSVGIALRRTLQTVEGTQIPSTKGVI